MLRLDINKSMRPKYRSYFAIGIAGLFMIGCNQDHDNKPEVQPKYEATTPMREDTSIDKEYVCQIHAIKHIEVRALERGYIQGIFVDEGQFVKQGQPMFKIMPNVYQAELAKAKAEVNTANIEYLNTKALADKNIVSENELALAKAKLDKANAEMNLMETHLSFTDIKAPFEGIMDHLEVRNGSLVEEGALLTTLSDIDKLWVYFNVPESEYLDYQAKKSGNDSTKVKLRMANGQIFSETGVVQTIEADFDNRAGNIEFRATFPNPNRILRHGETGTILMEKAYKNAMLIPQKATFDILDKTYVFVVNKDDVLEQRLVKIEASLPYLFIVKSGLNDGDRILLEGLRKVSAGQKVDIDLKSPDKVRAELPLYTE